jgi:hypothetical protein
MSLEMSERVSGLARITVAQSAYGPGTSPVRRDDATKP